MVKKITPVYDRVQCFLEAYPRYRDNDNMLVAKIWWDELFGNVAVKPENCTMGLFEFLMRYKDNKITPADYITRARRKVQEEYPHLRGKTYKQRKSKEAEETKEELRELGK